MKKNDDKWARDENGKIMTYDHGRKKFTKAMFENEADLPDHEYSDEEIDAEIRRLGLGEFLPEEEVEEEKATMVGNNSVTRRDRHVKLNRYLVKLPDEAPEVIPVASWSGSPDDIDGETLIPVAAIDEEQALQVARAKLRVVATAQPSVNICGTEYFVLENMVLTERFAQAFLFTHILHQKQKRKGTDIPYISHLIGVCSLVLEHGGDEDQAIAALLHDAVEDQGDNYTGGVEQLRNDIENDFGETVLRIVNGCTDADTVPKPPWRERKEAYIEHIQNADSDTRFVSCCDKLHNARAILTDYRAIGDDLWGRFNADKEDILWYYCALADAFQEGGRSPLAEELSRVVSDLEAESMSDKDKYVHDADGKVLYGADGKKLRQELFDEPIFEKVFENDEEIDAEIKRLGLSEFLPDKEVEEEEDTILEESQQLEEVLSWRFIAEFWRRFPMHFTLIEAHPCSGIYDCLVLLTKGASPKFAIDVNRGGGSVHVHKNAFGLGDDLILLSDWKSRMLAPKPEMFLDEVGQEARLVPPKKLPVSTPETIVYRFIAEFLTHSLGRLERWECRNGYEDTSGFGGGKRDHFFQKFPGLRKEESLRHTEPFINEYSYNFWFLIKNDDPVLCLDTSGIAYRTDGNSYDLGRLYKEKRRIWPLIFKVAEDVLP